MATHDDLDIDLLRSSAVQRFDGRLPDPTELLAWGGLPGCEYAMVAATNIPLAREQGWNPCRDVPSVTIVGPQGYCEMQVMAKGEPILGASPANGVRAWWYDPTLLSATGLSNPELPDNTIESTPSVADLNAKAARIAKATATSTAR